MLLRALIQSHCLWGGIQNRAGNSRRKCENKTDLDILLRLLFTIQPNITKIKLEECIFTL